MRNLGRAILWFGAAVSFGYSALHVDVSMFDKISDVVAVGLAGGLFGIDLKEFFDQY